MIDPAMLKWGVAAIFWVLWQAQRRPRGRRAPELERDPLDLNRRIPFLGGSCFKMRAGLEASLHGAGLFL